MDKRNDWWLSPTDEDRGTWQLWLVNDSYDIVNGLGYYRANKHFAKERINEYTLPRELWSYGGPSFFKEDNKLIVVWKSSGWLDNRDAFFNEVGRAMKCRLEHFHRQTDPYFKIHHDPAELVVTIYDRNNEHNTETRTIPLE